MLNQVFGIRASQGNLEGLGLKARGRVSSEAVADRKIASDFGPRSQIAVYSLVKGSP